MKRKLLLFGALALCLSGCASDGIPMIGLDDSGKMVERYASDGQFREELASATKQVTQATFEALQTAAQDQSGTLRSVVIGLGFNFQFGIEDIVTMGVQPKVRFAFSNSKNPIIP